MGGTSCPPPLLPAGRLPRVLFVIAGLSHEGRLQSVAPSLWHVHSMTSVELVACIVSVHVPEAVLPDAALARSIPPSCRVQRNPGASLMRHLLLLPPDVVSRADFVTVHIDSARLGADTDLGVLAHIMLANCLNVATPACSTCKTKRYANHE